MSRAQKKNGLPTKKPKKRNFDSGKHRERRETADYKAAAVQAVAKQHGVAKPIAAAMLTAGYPLQRVISKATDAIVGVDKWNTTKSLAPRRPQTAPMPRAQFQIKPHPLPAPKYKGVNAYDHGWSGGGESKQPVARSGVESSQRPTLNAPAVQTVGLGVVRQPHTAYRRVITNKDGSRVVKGKDFLTQISVATTDKSGDLLYQFTANPRAVAASVLKVEAGLYERFTGRWTIHAQPTASTGTSGSIMGYWEIDPNDSLPRTINDLRQVVFAHGGHVTTMWEESAWALTKQAPGRYYIDAGDDNRLSVQGLFNLLVDQVPSATVAFDVWLSYDIKLMNPKYDELAINPGGATYYPSYTAAMTTSDFWHVNDFNAAQLTLAWDESTLTIDRITATTAVVPFSISNWYFVQWHFNAATSVVPSGSTLIFGTAPFTFYASNENATISTALVTGAGGGIYAGTNAQASTYCIGWAVLYRPPALANYTHLRMGFSATVTGAAGPADETCTLNVMPMQSQDVTYAPNVGSVYPFSPDNVQGALRGISVAENACSASEALIRERKRPQAGDEKSEEKDVDPIDIEECHLSLTPVATPVKLLRAESKMPLRIEPAARSRPSSVKGSA